MQPYKLFIPPCTYEPAHKLHPPPLDMPLRIHIEGPLVSIQKLLPAEVWNHDVCDHPFPQPGGPELARLTFDELYGQAVRPPLPGDLVVRDEYLGWCGDPPNPITYVFISNLDTAVNLYTEQKHCSHFSAENTDISTITVSPSITLFQLTTLIRKYSKSTLSNSKPKKETMQKD